MLRIYSKLVKYTYKHNVRQINTDKRDDLQKYCNAVIRRMGPEKKRWVLDMAAALGLLQIGTNVMLKD